MGNDPFVDFPAGCWLWGYTQPLQRFSSHLVIIYPSLLKKLREFRANLINRTIFPPHLSQSILINKRGEADVELKMVKKNRDN